MYLYNAKGTSCSMIVCMVHSYMYITKLKTIFANRQMETQTQVVTLLCAEVYLILIYPCAAVPCCLPGGTDSGHLSNHRVVFQEEDYCT